MKLNKKNLFIFSMLFLSISVLVGYSYINSDLKTDSNVTVSKRVCNQSNLYERLACMSTMDNIKSKYVNNRMGIDFSKNSQEKLKNVKCKIFQLSFII